MPQAARYLPAHEIQGPMLTRGKRAVFDRCQIGKVSGGVYNIYSNYNDSDESGEIVYGP
jgi:hypothetical protein